MTHWRDKRLSPKKALNLLKEVCRREGEPELIPCIELKAEKPSDIGGFENVEFKKKRQGGRLRPIPGIWIKRRFYMYDEKHHKVKDVTEKHLEAMRKHQNEAPIIK